MAQNASESGSPLAGVAGRYASALFELARDERAVDAVAEGLDRFDALLTESDDLRRLVRSPAFSAEDQVKAIDAVLAKSGIQGLAANFIRLSAANRRLFALPNMIRAYRELIVTNLIPELAQIAVPVTVLYIQPKTVPLPAAQFDGAYKLAYAPVKQLTLKRIPDSAHFIMWDQPQRFRSEAAAFLSAK